MYEDQTQNYDPEIHYRDLVFSLWQGSSDLHRLSLIARRTVFTDALTRVVACRRRW